LLAIDQDPSRPRRRLALTSYRLQLLKEVLGHESNTNNHQRFVRQMFLGTYGSHWLCQQSALSTQDGECYHYDFAYFENHFELVKISVTY
jgi:hypothetical protein